MRAVRRRIHAQVILACVAIASSCASRELQPDAGQRADASSVLTPDVGATSCAATVDISGTTPFGSFSAATAVVNLREQRQCGASSLAVAISATDGAVLFINVVVDLVNGGPSGLGLYKSFAEFSIVSAGEVFVRDSIATVYVTQADPPPFAECARIAGDWLNAGSVELLVIMAQDGFSMTGSLSTVYCACDSCAG
jgi:hypothetical protein